MFCCKKIAGSVIAILIFSLGIIVPAQSQTDQGELAVCLTDLDMPFSNKELDKLSNLPGLYFELAELLSTKLNKKLKVFYTFSGFHKRPVREGLLAGNCTLQFGLPATEGPHYLEGEIELTQPVMDIGYVLVKKKNSTLSGVSDLQGKTIAVLTGSPPQMVLSSMEDVKLEYCLFGEIALEKLDKGEVDLAFIWGPEAGYINQFRYKNKFSIIRTNYEWPVAIGTAEKDVDLRNRLNQIIKNLGTQIEALKERYGFPGGSVLEIPGIRYDFK